MKSHQGRAYSTAPPFIYRVVRLTYNIKNFVYCLKANMEKHQYLLPFGIICILAAIAVYSIAYFSCEEKLEPQEIIARCQAKMYGLQSYRAEIVSTTVTSEGAKVNSNKTAYVAPDRYHCRSDGEDSWLEYIFIGNDQYYRASYGPEWRKGGVFDNRQIMIQISDNFKILGSLRNVDKLPNQNIDGAECYHYRTEQRADIDIEAQIQAVKEQLFDNPELLSGTDSMSMDEILAQYREQLERAAQGQTTIDLWIDKEDYLLRQMEITKHSLEADPEGNETWGTITSEYRWYDFNEHIEIAAPPLGDSPAEPETTPSPVSLIMPGTPVFHAEAGTEALTP